MKKCLLFIFFLIYIAIAHEYPRPIFGYYSQKGQDKFLNEEVFNGKEGGFFVDIGAHDGISFSNSYFFEKYLGWKGICIEPNPDIFPKLIQNRLSLCLQLAVAKENKKFNFLKCEGYMLEMYSGIFELMDVKHIERIEKEMQIFGGSCSTIEIQCKPISEILNEYNINSIDFINIDIEGGEEEAIKSIDFKKTKIKAILVENNFRENKIQKYLESWGYKYIRTIGKDDIYILGDHHE